MFTGIVQGLGRVRSVQAQAQDRDFVVDCPAPIGARLSLGASIALNGVCQTVTALEPAAFTVHAIAETLRVTTMGAWTQGLELNLEAALGAGEPLGGHFVQGHVDGTARLRAREVVGASTRFSFDVAPELAHQMVAKGSITLDGVSLTVGPEPAATSFDVFLIPHTLEVTTLGALRAGDLVNVETDILGKYILRYLSGRDAAGGVTAARLRDSGFGTDKAGGRP